LLPTTNTFVLPMRFPRSVKSRREGIAILGMTSCGIELPLLSVIASSSSSPLDDCIAWLLVSSTTLPSSSLSLNDFSDPDRGVLGIAESGCGLIFSGVSGWLLRLIDDAADPRLRCVRYGDSDDRNDAGDAADEACAEGCSLERMRWPVAAILGCTGLPALRLRPATAPPSALASAPASALLLFVRDRLESDAKAELMVSARLSTPKLLPSILSAGGVCIDPPCVLSELLDALRPRCTLRSISFSLRRKKVVGPEWPGLASDGGLTMGFLPLIVRAS